MIRLQHKRPPGAYIGREIVGKFVYLLNNLYYLCLGSQFYYQELYKLWYSAEIHSLFIFLSKFKRQVLVTDTEIYWLLLVWWKALLSLIVIYKKRNQHK